MHNLKNFCCYLGLIAIFLSSTMTKSPAALVEKTTYNGVDAYRLQSGQTEAVVVPAFSGRVMRFGEVGGANWLWNAAPEKLSGDGFKNYGGDKTFAGPHALWGTFAGNIWPPEPSWDGGVHQATVLPNGHLRTTGTLWRGFGVRVIREFSFENDEFVVSQTLEKVEGEPRVLSIWQVAQVAPPDAVFLPLNTQSSYQNNFYAFGVLNENARVQNVSASLLKITPAAGASYKLGADSPVSAIAAVKGRSLLLLRSARPEGQYPDGADGAGFPVEFYNHGEDGAGRYVELELLSPMRRFVKGARWTHTIRWSLHNLPNEDGEKTRTIEALLAGSSTQS